MNQQINIQLTLTANAALSKEEVQKKIEEMFNFATLHSTTHERMLIPEIKVVGIQEEAEIYDVELTEQDKKIAEAKQLLKDAGYFTDNLWTITDVKDKLEGSENLTDDEAQDILNKALTNEATMEQIWFGISEFGFLDYNLNTKD